MKTSVLGKSSKRIMEESVSSAPRDATGGTAKKSEKPAARRYRGEYTMLVCEA